MAKRKIPVLSRFRFLFFLVFPFLIFSFQGKTQEDLDFTQKDEGVTSEERKNLEENKEILQTEDHLVSEQNPLTGVMDAHHFTKDDRYRHTIVLHGGPFRKLWGFEYGFGKNMGNFWFQGFLSRIVADFGTLSQNTAPGTASTDNPKAEIRFPRPEDTEEQFSQLGLGLGFRHKISQSLNIFKISHLFQTTEAYLTYMSLDEGLRYLEYQGWGLRADYGLHKRISISSHVGLKFSYNLAMVKRGEEGEDEPNNDRRLFLSWVSLAFDYSYYF